MALAIGRLLDVEEVADAVDLASSTWVTLARSKATTSTQGGSVSEP